jgi:hypothetical protein
MEERERCYSFVLCRTPHGFNNIFELFGVLLYSIHKRVLTPDRRPVIKLIPKSLSQPGESILHWPHLRDHYHHQPINGAQALPLMENGSPRGSNAGWWVLTVNAVGNNGLKCLLKQGGADLWDKGKKMMMMLHSVIVSNTAGRSPDVIPPWKLSGCLRSFWNMKEFEVIECP